VKAREKAARALNEAIEELVPLVEIRDRPQLKEGDKLTICKTGSLFGKEVVVIKDMGRKIQVKLSGYPTTLKHTQLSMVLQRKAADGALPKPTVVNGKPSRTSKAAAKALEFESKSGRSSSQIQMRVNPSLAMRTDGNTVDVCSCNLMEAKEKVTSKISQCKMRGHTSVYILHGHGRDDGALKSKLRTWLKTEKRLVKKWTPADQSDGGDAFTRLEI